MKPVTWARVVYSRQADAVKRAMDEAHRDRLKAAIEVIKNGPEDGDFAGHDTEGVPLFQMTAADTHVIYQVVFWEIGRVLRIALIEIRDWAPLDTGPTQGTRRRSRR